MSLAKLCALHRAHYRQWKGHRFDPISGDRWPGTAHVFFNAGCGSSNMGAMRETAAREWAQKNDALLLDIVAACLAHSGCSGQPDILEWCTAGARLWRAEADGLRFTVDASLSAPYPDAGNGSGSVDLEVARQEDSGFWEVLSLTTHPHPRVARVAAHAYWKSL